MARYRIYCSTDSKWEFKDDSVAPTQCPTDAGHSVVSDSVASVLRETSLPKATAKIFESFSVTSDPTFENCGGVVTNTQYYIADLSNALGRLTLEAKVSGTGAEVKMVEYDINGQSPVDVIPATAVADTAGAWTLLSLNSSVQLRTGSREFCIEARLNGATSMDLRFGGVALLELL